MLRSLKLVLLMLLPFAGSGQCIEFHPLPEIVSLTGHGNTALIGTRTQGLFTLNLTTGVTQQFDHSNSELSGNRVRSMTWYNDSLLLSTDSSLQFFDQATSTFRTYHPGLNGQLAVDNQGRLVVAMDTALLVLEGGNIVYQKYIYDILQNESWANMTDVVVDQDNTIWLSHFQFYEFDILSYDGTEWTNFGHDTDPGLPIESPTYNGLMAIGNTIYATNWGGLFEYYGSGWISLHSHIDPRISDGVDTVNAELLAIERDLSTGYWVGTGPEWPFDKSGRIAYHNDGSWTLLPHFSDSIFQVNVMYSLNTDKVLAGTSKGLAIIDKACLGLPTSLATEPLSPQVQFYPNPTSGLLDSDFQPTSDVHLYDLAGHKLTTFDHSRQIDLSALPSGLYLLQWEESGVLFNQQIEVVR